MKRYLLIFLSIFQVILLFSCRKKDVEYLILPERANVISVRLYYINKCRTIVDDKEIDDLFSELSFGSIRSRNSYNDTPMTDDFLMIVFEIPEGLSSDIVYIFRNGDYFYVEQPYYGIFSIDESKYRSIFQHLEM